MVSSFTDGQRLNILFQDSAATLGRRLNMGVTKIKICGAPKFENHSHHLTKFLLSSVLWNTEFWKGVYAF